MNTVLLHPLYFGPIDYYKTVVEADKILWEADDHYQKQTYRTRQYIFGANGRLLLNIPIRHAAIKGEKQVYKQVQIENSESWQSIHWKSLESAYQNSPYFAYYKDDLRALFKMPYKSLVQFNLDCTHRILDCLGLSIENGLKKESLSEEVADYKALSTAKRNPSQQIKSYFQVFSDKHGFLPNLSILDLLFNLGPESVSYLQNLERD